MLKSQKAGEKLTCLEKEKKVRPRTSAGLEGTLSPSPMPDCINGSVGSGPAPALSVSWFLHLITPALCISRGCDKDPVQ